MKSMRKFRLYMGATGMLILILDGRTALSGMVEGIELCLYTLFPSLFPFSVLSALITEATLGTKIPILQPITKRLGIPEGAESLLLIGWLGGYPIGAQAVADAQISGHLTPSDAQKLAIICNNPGPAFLFGVLGSVISGQRNLWCLWGIQIISSLLICRIIPDNIQLYSSVHQGGLVPFPDILRKSALSMINIGSSVVFFRTVLKFLQQWIFHRIPETLGIALTGIMELSNGCILLSNVHDQSIRLILASGLLSFGGVCVGMQTTSALKDLKISRYLAWKAIQSIFCISMTALIVLPISKSFPFLPVVGIPGIYFLIAGKKKDIAFA